ncbi:fumarylacetoacetate hydrolase family protein [Gryllotalpicola protaetiae]|uniref:Fumarylacetoacetate hydrolase n=1 Tax=Gryllotalpicola protaetiae TaxID=2419771 RepID=A0A387BSR2_9MICO|nr:fumarylacetoacetate hydrolase family protein [Gryllotalpicola protaetiae]AYG04099.1 fumarylacetoacetate hydrolase [Gryllotalpicola protaetiae]
MTTDASQSRPELALARVELDGDVLWAVRRGDEYAPLGITLAELLRLPAAEARAAVEAAAGPGIRPSRILAPVDPQHEVWAAGVTYLRSRDGRIEEATDGTPYDRVYGAERPELFFKSTGVRVVGDGEPVGKRADSTWDVPESELGIVVDSAGEIFGYVPGNDSSSRSIEGENLLYLPQAKVFTAGCALGPEIVPAWAATPPFGIRLLIERDGVAVFDERTSTDQLARSLDDLAGWLFRGLDFPDGVIVLTGTGVVPPAEFTLHDGDEVTIEIEGVGTLRNPVVTVGRA